MIDCEQNTKVVALKKSLDKPLCFLGHQSSALFVRSGKRENFCNTFTNLSGIWNTKMCVHNGNNRWSFVLFSKEREEKFCNNITSFRSGIKLHSIWHPVNSYQLKYLDSVLITIINHFKQLRNCKLNRKDTFVNVIYLILNFWSWPRRHTVGQNPK